MIRTHVFIVATALALAPGEVARADPTINFFGDVEYRVVKQGTTSNEFQAPSLDIFAMQTEKNFTFTGEMIAEAFGQNDFEIDVDRLEVGYKPTPWSHIAVGRIRTSLGYYSDAYQNGKFFMTPVSWPEMYEGLGFDGIVPSHGVGVHGDVARDLGNDNGKLTLDAEVLNGRGRDLDETQAFQDANNGKAVDLRLRYVGQGDLDGLIVGGNVYVDDIPDDTIETTHVAMHELIVGGHAAYITPKIHAVAELFWFRHREHGTEILHTTLAAVGEAGYTFGDFTPYGRVEVFKFSDADPYFTTSGFSTVDHEIVSAGVKYAASASVALKLQGSVIHDTTQDGYVGITQAAFAF